jgi:hypothetical protein
MKRIALYLAVALLTFMLGITLSALRKAPKLTDSEIKVCLLEPSMCVDQDLVRRLLAIDKEYEARCGMNCFLSEEDVANNERLTRCYSEWGEARRVAVEGD